MALTHHRKKHRSHVRQFRSAGAGSSSAARGNARSIFAIAGGITGLAVGYFSTSGSIVGILTGLFLGAGVGFYIGKGIDRED
jgi:hypothetical protein